MNSAAYFYEVFEEEKLALLRHLPPGIHAEFSPLAIQETDHHDPPAPVISIRTQSVIPASWAPQLQAVLSRSAGFDHLVRFKEQTGTNAQLGHLFRYSGRAVAEQAALMWMGLLRKLPLQMDSARTFTRDGLTGRENAGKTIAIFGVGDIGHHIAEIARGLGMHVLGVDIVQRHADIRYVSPDEGLANADILVSAMNLTHVNREYFRYETLRACRAGTIFINVARGEFVTCRDLLRLLDEGRLGGVGLDVYNEEPLIAPALREHLSSDHPELIAFKELSRRHDAILTPHNAFNTLEAVERKSAQTARQLESFFKHGVFLDQTQWES